MAEARPIPFDRFGEWLNSLRGQLTCFAACVLLLVLCVCGHEVARVCGFESLFAPTRDDFWRGIGVSAAVGLVPLITALLRELVTLPFRQPDSATCEEVTGWRLWVQYVYVGCYLVLISAMPMGLFLWCHKSELSPFPPLLAMLVVQFVISLLWRGAFSRWQAPTVGPTP